MKESSERLETISSKKTIASNPGGEKKKEYDRTCWGEVEYHVNLKGEQTGGGAEENLLAIPPTLTHRGRF